MEPVVDENNHSVQNSGSAATTDNGDEGSEYEYYSQTEEAGQDKDGQEYGAEEDEEYDDEYDDEDDQEPV